MIFELFSYYLRPFSVLSPKRKNHFQYQKQKLFNSSATDLSVSEIIWILEPYKAQNFVLKLLYYILSYQTNAISFTLQFLFQLMSQNPDLSMQLKTDSKFGNLNNQLRRFVVGKTNWVTFGKKHYRLNLV